MADPATNTSYPGAIDPLPEIGPNSKQNDPAIEHDVMHDKAHALLNVLQALLGTNGDDATATTVLGRLLALADAVAEKLGDAPTDGIIHGRKDGDWVPVADGEAKTLVVITEASTARTLSADDAGIRTYLRFTNAALTDVVFDSAASYLSGMVFNIRAVGAAGVELMGDGVTLTPPKGGTLVLEQGDTVTVIMSSATAGDVMGSTELAP